MNIQKSVFIFTLMLVFTNIFTIIKLLYLRDDISKMQNIVVIKPDATSYANWILTMPRSNFRDNMFIVVSAEFGKDSELVNKILQSYVELKEEK